MNRHPRLACLLVLAMATEPAVCHDVEAPSGTTGPDMQHCQLMNLSQFGRLDDKVGLALMMTSWNVGDTALTWQAMPAADHPFTVMNLYRLKDDRFEQIGQSWAKHGYCALGSVQCGGSCAASSCDTLNPNCTDTSSGAASANQDVFGPRSEINPWSGAWSYAGSHNSQGSHSHNPIEHRLEVHDADLDPALNTGATYYAESYHVSFDDVDVLNSAAYKPTTVAGSPGGSWSFGMSGSSAPPEIGFALDAWPGADYALFAPEMPVVEFASPDGRGVIAAKSTDLGAGMWHYEYAVLNIDLNRKVGALTIPLPEGTTITNVGFHAVNSNGEGYSNAPWTPDVTETAIAFSTVDNPIRWGTLYNFRFDADAPPGRDDAIIGLYEPGSPATLIVSTAHAPAPDCNGNNIADADDIAAGAPDGNGNGVPDECDIAVADVIAEGPRYLAVELVGAGAEVALYLTGDADDPAVSCVAAYIQADGKLGPGPLFQDLADWPAATHVSGAQIMPGATYAVQIDTGTPGNPILGPWVNTTTWMWGDVNNNRLVNFTDIWLVVRGFQGDFTLAPREAVDLHPCIPNGTINFADISWDVKAFQGTAYLDTECTAPCPR